jgi:hypothetical protein
MSDLKKVSRALISVSDKNGVVDFARALNALGVELLSTGGTFRLLQENNIAVTEVSDYTGFPEMMDGRVKTLHPKVHGGILGRRGTDDAVMAEHAIKTVHYPTPSKILILAAQPWFALLPKTIKTSRLWSTALITQPYLKKCKLMKGSLITAPVMHSWSKPLSTLQVMTA